MPNRDLIVVGASSGGITAVRELLGQLPPDLPAAVLIVLHTSPHAPNLLPHVLGRDASFPIISPQDGDHVSQGHAYIAPPDYHMVVSDSKVRLTRGPHENGTRPAVDPLFRSAAINYRSRAIGVILTGALDDGTAGLLAVKTAGGMAVVQDPSDAEFPGMPQSALAYVDVDYRLPLREMGSVLDQLTRQSAPPPPAVPDLLPTENSFAEAEGTPPRLGDRLPPSPFSCPECGGVLYEFTENKFRHFRCRVGHAYSPETLVEAQGGEIERSVWAAIRLLQSRAEVSETIAQRHDALGHTHLAETYYERARESRTHAEVLRKLVLNKTP